MISVIIPTFNRAALLKRTLSSFSDQTLKDDRIEFLIIDNGSTDPTKHVVEEAVTLFRNIRYIYEPDPGLHAGRHRGMLEASNEILLFIDDDVKAFPTLLEGVHESFQNTQVGIVGGKNLPDYESAPPEWINELWIKTAHGSFIPYYSVCDFGNETFFIDPIYIFGCNFSVRKSVLLEVSGFHPDGLPPDKLKYRGDGETYVAEEAKALGWLSVYNPKASVYHWVPATRMNKDYIFKRAFAEGISKSYADIRKGKSQSLTKFKKRLSKFKSFLFSPKKTFHIEIQTSFEKGYNFHQQEVRNDTDLYDWVTRKNYLPDV